MPKGSPLFISMLNGKSSLNSRVVFNMRASMSVGKPGKLVRRGPSPCTEGMNCPVVLW